MSILAGSLGNRPACDNDSSYPLSPYFTISTIKTSRVLSSYEVDAADRHFGKNGPAVGGGNLSPAAICANCRTATVLLKCSDRRGSLSHRFSSVVPGPPPFALRRSCLQHMRPIPNGFHVRVTKKRPHTTSTTRTSYGRSATREITE